MPVKLIATDLDYTLMHIDKSISYYTAGVFRRCRERRIVTAFATARSEKASERARRLVQPELVVTCCGALVRLGGKILSCEPMPAGLAWEIAAFCRGLSSAGKVLAEMEDGRYLVSYPIPPGATGDYAHAEQYDFERPFDTGAFKLVIEISDNRDRESLRSAYPGAVVHAYSNSNHCFISAEGVSKWKGILLAAKSLGVGREEIVCFGDDHSDIEMLRECGIGVAVENAIPEVKSAADQICGHCDSDGVARWLEENVL